MDTPDDDKKQPETITLSPESEATITLKAGEDVVAEIVGTALPGLTIRPGALPDGAFVTLRPNARGEQRLSIRPVKSTD